MAQKLPKVKASTQQHLDIDDILENLVIHKSGWVSLVMSTTAVNFDLLSEAEQDATIYAYGAFLNSLSFPIQILIRSKKADITSYFQLLEEALRSQPNPDLKLQIQKYQDFIKATVQQKTVLDKKFYLIITYSPLQGGIVSFGKKKKTYSTPKGQLIEQAKNNLFPRRDHVIKQTSRLGLSTKQLSSQELIELFYDIYNPAPTGTQRVLLDSDSYTAPLVEPAIENPAPAPQIQPLAQETPPLGTQPPSANPLPASFPPGTETLSSQPQQTPQTFQPSKPSSQSFAPNQADIGFATQNPAVTPAPPQSNPNLDPKVSEALRSLQEATARASAGIQQPPQQQIPPNPNVQGEENGL